MFTKVHLNQEQYLTARRKYRIEIPCRNVVLIESRVYGFHSNTRRIYGLGVAEIQGGRIPNFCADPQFQSVSLSKTYRVSQKNVR